MSRINTNVSSLLARTVLGRSSEQLQESLIRLSTGLRINTGKDDPSGLIASENLRRDIVSVEAAIANSERANQVIGTADSALGQVSSLLNDIRGLVTESANTGALSDEQIAANQLQVDSSLEALNRIAQTTSFQGRRLLDGSLDFLTNAFSVASIENLQIDQANLGVSGLVNVNVNIAQGATQGQLTNAVTAYVAGTAASDATGYSSEVTTAEVLASGTVTLTNTGSSFTLTAVDGQGAEGAAGNATDVIFTNSENTGDAVDVTYDGGANTLTIDVDTSALNDVDAITAAIDAEGTFASSAIAGGTNNYVVTDDGTITTPLTGGVDEVSGTDVLTVTANNEGTTANGVTVTFTETNGQGATPSASFNGNNIVVLVDDTADTSLSAVATAINGLSGNLYTAVASGDGDGDYNVTQTDGVQATLAGGIDASGGVVADVTFELAGSNGSEVFTFGANTSAQIIADAINSQSDATGVTAVNNSNTLELTSVGYGSNATVDVTVLSEGTGGTFETGFSGTFRATGADIQATVNGVTATGDGNRLSINTSTLDLALNVTAGSATDFNFNITGGGALFQLGPDVVSNQQARLGIGSVNSAKLGGVSGKLFQLGSGNSADLASDPTKAAEIIAEAINQVTSLRGRLGAFQKTAIDTNINALNDVLVNLTEAESVIRDADFAAESAALTRAQILVQSGTSVLAIANSNPQNVLALLR